MSIQDIKFSRERLGGYMELATRAAVCEMGKERRWGKIQVRVRGEAA